MPFLLKTIDGCVKSLNNMTLTVSMPKMASQLASSPEEETELIESADYCSPMDFLLIYLRF